MNDAHKPAQPASVSRPAVVTDKAPKAAPTMTGTTRAIMARIDRLPAADRERPVSALASLYLPGVGARRDA